MKNGEVLCQNYEYYVLNSPLISPINISIILHNLQYQIIHLKGLNLDHITYLLHSQQ